MVVFTCNHCGDSLQKPKVEKHYETRCRYKNPDLCCVDCLKDFRNDEFKTHLKCVTEAERYGGKGYVPKECKGEKKQNAWIEIVQSVLEENRNLSGPVRILLEKVSKQPNTPRKEGKFFNFVKSMDPRTNVRDVETAWNLLKLKLQVTKNNAQNTKQNTEKTNGVTSDDAAAKENIVIDNTPSNQDDGITQKKSKKNKKTKINSNENNIETSNGDIENIVNNNIENKKEKKKDKTKDKKSINDLNEIDVKNLNGDNEKIDNIENKKGKKKNKNKKANNDVTFDTQDIKENGNAAQEVTENNVLHHINQEESQLSKKERKEKKKREKYEAQLEAIRNETTDMNSSIDANKKSKKRKLEETRTEEPEVKTEEPANKKSKKDDAEAFNWTDAILSILNSKNKSILLKKLEKRVLTEYCATTNTEVVTERINKKFTKALRKIENLKIENEKVSIESNNE